MTANEDAALAAWRDVVGPENLETGTSALREAETATFGTTQRIPAILRPANREQVHECLAIASRFGIPVYPVSGGKNWGYGSRVPVVDRCALLDLGRMNRILDFSEDLGYVTVEPGVTQGQLYSFLQERRSRLWMDATGATPEASVVGNTLERGFGHTPYGDHFEHVCGLEVILPNGDLIQTGFGRFEGSAAAPVSRWGLGPSLDGLFSQSNLGVVTRMTVWLMPAPEYFQAYFFSCDDESGLGSLVEALRPLRLNGTIRSTVHIGNDYKVISGIRQYPWEETGGKTPLDGELLRVMRGRFQIGRWSGSGALYGTRAQVAEARRLIRRALAGKVRKLQFLDDRILNLAQRFAKPYQWITGWDLGRTLEMVRPVYGLMKGIPTSHPLASTYWRKRHTPPAEMNPDRDGCGLLWCSPVAPATGLHADQLARLSEETVLKHGFEPMLSISMVSDRALTCVISLNYDRSVPGEDQRASICHRDLLERLRTAGYHTYRLSIEAMDTIKGQAGDRRLLSAIKNAVDPHGILAPGRYESRSGDQTAAGGGTTLG